MTRTPSSYANMASTPPPPPGIIISNLAGLYCTSGVRVSFILPIVDRCKSVKGESYTVTLEFPTATKVYSQVYSKNGSDLHTSPTRTHNKSQRVRTESQQVKTALQQVTTSKKLHYNKSQQVTTSQNCITNSHNESKTSDNESKRVKNE